MVRLWEADPKALCLRMMVKRARRAAKEKGLAFDIDVDEVKTPDVCPALGIALDYGYFGRSGFSADSPTLDRLIPELGYVTANVRVISWRANAIKRDASTAEVEAVAHWMRAVVP